MTQDLIDRLNTLAGSSLPYTPLEGKSLMVATPCYTGRPTMEWVMGMVRLGIAIQHAGAEMHMHTIKSCADPSLARNRHLHAFRLLNADWILMVDDDMDFRSEDVINMMRSGHDVVAAVCPQKRIDWTKVLCKAIERPGISSTDLSRSGAHMIVNYLDDQGQKMAMVGDCIEVKELGTGMMLISREAIEKMRKAYPELTYDAEDDEGRVAEFHGLFEKQMVDRRRLPDDFAFCHRWRAIGGKVMAYLPAELKHIGSYAYGGRIMDTVNVET